VRRSPASRAQRRSAEADRGDQLAHTFADGKAEGRRKTQYFELGCNRGLYHDGWMASAPSFVPRDPNRQEWDPDKAVWELYKIDEDFSQVNDLAAKNPQKLRELQDLWWIEASKYNVLPLDWRGTIRMNAEAMGRPSLTGGRTSMTYYPGTIGLPDAASPRMCNKSWTITADIEALDDKAEGMIVTHGGLEGGYGLYLRDGKPTFVYNFLAPIVPHSPPGSHCRKAKSRWSSTSNMTAGAWARAARSP
jgi:hypothetical protein